MNKQAKLAIHVLLDRVADNTRYIVEDPPSDYEEGMKRYVAYLRYVAYMIEDLLK